MSIRKESYAHFNKHHEFMSPIARSIINIAVIETYIMIKHARLF